MFTATEETRNGTVIRLKKNKKLCLKIRFQNNGIVFGEGDSCLTWALLHVPQMRVAASEPTEPLASNGQISFHGRDSILSNFHEDRCPFEFQGSMYPTVENCYQTAKFTALKRPRDETKVLATEKKPYTVKELSHTAKNDPKKPEWELIKIDKMFPMVLSRGQQSYEFRAHLLATDGKRLIHDVSDTDWGLPHGNGVNAMGRILEHVRSVLRTLYTDSTQWTEHSGLSDMSILGAEIKKDPEEDSPNTMTTPNTPKHQTVASSQPNLRKRTPGKLSSSQPKP